MIETFATVGWDENTDMWSVCVGERIESKHETKKEAIKQAKQIDSVNTVMAFTKGNSNFKSIRC